MQDRLTVSELADRLLALERPLIAFHTSPDGDAVGSAAGLCLIFRALGKDAVCVCADEIPERLRFIRELCPEGSFICGKTVDVSEYEPITVDLAAPSQLGAYAEVLASGATRFMIDHHARGSYFAPVCVASGASAAGELLCELALELIARGAMSAITPALASALYAAICSDTGCFKFANVTPRTFEVAAILLAAGADAAETARLLFDTKSERRLRAEAETIRLIRRFDGGSISSVILTQQYFAESGLTEADFDGCIDVVRTLAGTETAITLRERPDRSLKVSLRSRTRSAVDVCTAFGGGGHVRAAACTFPAGTDPIDAERALVEALVAQGE